MSSTVEKHFTRNAGLIAFGTTISRILGYFRDMLVAHTFGAGFAADAFYAAYRIPNLLRRLLGEGALSASFIPVLGEYLHTKTKQETEDLINSLLGVLSLILIVLTILGIIFSKQLVGLIAYGFTSDTGKLDLTINLTQLMFPFIFFICLAAITLGVLNSLGAFFIPAVAPASLSIAEIFFVLGLAPILAPDNQIRGLAISVIIGGAGQLFVQIPGILRLGWKLRPKLNFAHPGIKKIVFLMIPSMIGLSVDQINSFVDTICASFLAQGSITALYYSNRIMQMPLAIFGLALASVALPSMSKSAAEKNVPALKNTVNFSIRIILYILIPSAVGLAVIGLPIIKVLFERGAFTSEASTMTYWALLFYSLGLPAFAMVKILASAFYASQETKTPMKIALVAMLVNITLNIMLMGPLGVGGLALATTIASWSNALILGFMLRKNIGKLGIKKILNTTFQTLIASGLMAASAYFLCYVVFMNNMLVGMFTSLIGAVIVFFAASIILNIEERKPLFSLIIKDKPQGSD